MDAQSTIDDQKQMLNHLHTRIQDHMKEKNMLIEMNTELEEQLEKKEKHVKEVANYHRNSRDEYKEALATWGKKNEISKNIIKQLQTENSVLKKKLDENVEEESNGINKLLEEIEGFKKVNKDKEILIQKFEKEKEMLQEELLKLENEKETLNIQLDSKNTENEKVQNLSDELGILYPRLYE